MKYCQDGSCPETRNGVKHHESVDTCYEKIYGIKNQSERIFIALSLCSLIIGIGLLIIITPLEFLNTIVTEHLCIKNAIYNNTSEGDYVECLDKKIDTAYYRLLITLLLLSSSILGYLGKFTYRKIPRY